MEKAENRDEFEIVEFEMSKEDLASIALKAHYADKTLNDYIVDALKNYIKTLKVN